MKHVWMLAVAFALLGCGKAHALGLDLGVLHVRGTKIKIGDTVEVKLRVDSIEKDELFKKQDRIRLIKGMRKDSDEKFKVFVYDHDLDDESRKLLKDIKSGTMYRMRLERRPDDDWKLVTVKPYTND